MVVDTKTYDPSEFPAFAVTVDIVVLTMANGRLHALLVQRGVDPFEGMWAIPGGFKRPAETLDEAAQRELLEETGVDGATLLRQFGAYGDPGRDPRMNVVTVAYVAVIRDIGTPAASTDAPAAVLVPAPPAASPRSSFAPAAAGSTAARSGAGGPRREGGRARPLWAARGPSDRGCPEAYAGTRRGPDPGPRDGRDSLRYSPPRRRALLR